jgi:enoyl-CoA hydratase
MEQENTVVRYAAADGVATLTLDSPQNRNAISSRLVAQLLAGLEAAAEDPAVRVVVLTHTGNTFCAGADLSEATSGGDASDAPAAAASAASGPSDLDAAAVARARALTGLLRAIVELPKPVVAALDGHVRAGGMGLVAACDLAVAGPKSTFALTEARIGVAPSIISLTVLPRLSSRAASRYFLTGETFGAAEAAALGLVTVAAEDLDKGLAELVGPLRLGSPQGLAESKKLVTAAVLAGFDALGEELAATSARLFRSAEAVEGMTAFLERRPPSWAL